MTFELFVKDIRCLWRLRRVLVATGGFALLLVVVSSFAFLQVGYSQADLKDLTPGITTIIFLFCGVSFLNYSFLLEEEDGALQGVLLTPVEPFELYAAKCLSTLVFLLPMQLLVLSVHAILFGVELFDVFLELSLVTVLSTVGFICLGTLFSSIAVATRGRELVLPLLLYPLLLPLVAASVSLSREILVDAAIPFDSFWFSLLCGFDVVALCLSWVLFEHAVRP